MRTWTSTDLLRCPHPLTGTITDGFEDASKDAPAAALIAHPREGGRKNGPALTGGDGRVCRQAAPSGRWQPCRQRGEFRSPDRRGHQLGGPAVEAVQAQLPQP